LGTDPQRKAKKVLKRKRGEGNLCSERKKNAQKKSNGKGKQSI